MSTRGRSTAIKPIIQTALTIACGIANTVRKISGATECFIALPPEVRVLMESEKLLSQLGQVFIEDRTGCRYGDRDSIFCRRLGGSCCLRGSRVGTGLSCKAGWTKTSVVEHILLIRHTESAIEARARCTQFYSSLGGGGSINEKRSRCACSSERGSGRSSACGKQTTRTLTTGPKIAGHNTRGPIRESGADIA